MSGCQTSPVDNGYLSNLPNGWREERLLNVAELRTSSVDKKSEDGEKAVKLCNYVDVYYHDKITAGLSFMEATASDSQIERFAVRAGDVVITKDSESPDHRCYHGPGRRP